MMADSRLNSRKEYERQRNQTEKPKEDHAANLKRWRRQNPQKMAVQLA